MALFALFVGVAFLVSAIRGTQDQLLQLVVSDFTGNNNFGIWALAVVILGAIGAIPSLKPLSNGLLVLIVLVILLSNRGFFAQFTSAVQS